MNLVCDAAFRIPPRESLFESISFKSIEGNRVNVGEILFSRSKLFMTFLTVELVIV